LAKIAIELQFEVAIHQKARSGDGQLHAGRLDSGDDVPIAVSQRVIAAAHGASNSRDDGAAEGVNAAVAHAADGGDFRPANPGFAEASRELLCRRARSKKQEAEHRDGENPKSRVPDLKLET